MQMYSQPEIYREIIRTISKVFSSVALALASFISIVFVLVLNTPGTIIRVSGYDVAFTPTLVLLSATLSFSSLAIACLLLASLLLIETEDDSSYNN